MFSPVDLVYALSVQTVAYCTITDTTVMMTMMLIVIIMMMRNDEPVNERTDADRNLTIFRRLSWSTMSRSGQASATCSTVQTFLKPNLLFGHRLKKSHNENCIVTRCIADMLMTNTMNVTSD